MPVLETGLETVANLVAHSRGDLMLLLELHGWEIPPGISAEKLTGAVLETLERDRSNRFARYLVRLATAESHFFGEAQTPPINVGADPVSAIAGGVGALASLTQSLVDRKTIKQQANAATMNALVQSRPPVVQAQPLPPEPRSRSVWPWFIGVIVVAGLGGLAFYLKSRRS